jgi:diacylglycerol kinase (ATP)
MDIGDLPLSCRLKNQRFLQRLGFALAGLAVVRRRERSFRSQLALASASICALLLLRPGLVWAALVTLCIGFVLAMEAMNAALEYAIDLLHPQIAEEIRFAKDAAAGAVLIASLTAAILGALMVASLL